MYKYTIHYLLNRLPQEDYQIAMIFFPYKLAISKSTWKQWIYIKQNEKREIPQKKLIEIAAYFDVSIEELFTIETRPQKPLKVLLDNFKLNVLCSNTHTKRKA